MMNHSCGEQIECYLQQLFGFESVSSTKHGGLNAFQWPNQVSP